jgi:hypothetical protein
VPDKTAAGPIVIGGVGGSGTRLLAEIISDLGFYIGGDLNHASDCQTFTLLLKRPKWVYRNYESPLTDHLDTLSALLLGEFPRSVRQVGILLAATLDMFVNGHQFEKPVGKGVWALRRCIRGIRTTGPDPSRHIGWGWKEPNSWLFLRHLQDHFPDLRYIHTIRHGLDMAYSSNQNQAYNWGRLVGLEACQQVTPEYSLRYWLRANRKALEMAEPLGDRFYLLHYDDFCLNPAEGIGALIDFLGLEAASIGDLDRRPQVPASMGRYKQYPLDHFSPAELDEVRSLGFEV